MCSYTHVCVLYVPTHAALLAKATLSIHSYYLYTPMYCQSMVLNFKRVQVPTNQCQCRLASFSYRLFCCFWAFVQPPWQLAFEIWMRAEMRKRSYRLTFDKPSVCMCVKQVSISAGDLHVYRNPRPVLLSNSLKIILRSNKLFA